MAVDGRGDRLGWTPVLIASAAHFCMFADRAMPSALAPALHAQFGLSDTQIGALIGTAMIVPYAVATILAGHLMSRFSPYRVMALSILCWTAAVAAGALSRNYGELVAARIAFGIAQAAFAPAALSLIGISRDPRPAVAISVFSTGSASGRSGGLLIGGLLLWLAGHAATPGGLAPWRLASLWLLAPNIALAAALILYGRRPFIVIPPRGGGMGRAFRWMAEHKRAFGCHFAAAAGALTIVQAGGAWAPSLMGRNGGLDPAASAMVMGAIVLIGAPMGHLAAGQYAGRKGFGTRGPARAMTGGALASFAFCVALTMAQGPVAVGTTLAGLIVCGGFSAAMALIALQPMVPGEHRMAAVSLFLAATTMAGYGLGPLLTGLLSDRMGGHSGTALAVALMLVVAGGAIVTCLAAIPGSAAWATAVSDSRMLSILDGRIGPGMRETL